MKIEIYGKKWCSYCYKAKQLCEREKLDFLYKELNKDFTREEMLEQFPGAKTFPQIIMDGKNVGGYTELAIKLGKSPNNTENWVGIGTVKERILFICYIGSITQLIFASTMLEGNFAFFITIGNVAFLVVASHFLIKWRKERKRDLRT